MVNFARQEDKAKDPKSHLYRQEENRKYDRVGALERTAASEGLYKSMQGAGLNLFMPAAIVAREDGIDSRKLARRREYVSAASALVRVMEPRVGSQSAQLSGDSRRASPERRPRAKSAVPHAGDKLNDALSRAWTDRQDSLRQSKAAAAVKQLLAEAKQVDSASTAAIAKAEQTIGKLYARSQRGSQRSPEDAGDKSCAPCASLPATEQDTPDELDSSMAATTKQRGEEKRKRVSSARLSSPVNKTKELDGKARVWDISGGLHVAGASRDMRSPFLENKMKRQDSHAHASNTMRPASAALVLGSPSKMAESNGQLLEGNSIYTLRYPSGAPETAPHRGEMREDVHCLGSHWNFRFRNKKQHTFAAEIGSSVRPKSAYPDLSPNKATGEGKAKTLSATRSEKQGQRPTSVRVRIADAEASGKGDPAQRGGSARPKDERGRAEKETVSQDATAMSISVGMGEAEQGTFVDGHVKGSTDGIGRMMWEGMDGERISPRASFHRKRTDLTSRGQKRMGYGLNPMEIDYSVKLQQSPVLGLKTLQAKLLKHKQYAESIASATDLQRPKSGGLGLGMPKHSALPLCRPSENNWAYQTLYLPKTAVHYHPGNVSKIIRNIDYQKERPTFGPHFASN